MSAANRQRGAVRDPTKDRRLKQNRSLPPTPPKADVHPYGQGRVKNPASDRRLKGNRK